MLTELLFKISFCQKLRVFKKEWGDQVRNTPSDPTALLVQDPAISS
jgi:hypothetical protein